MPALVLSGDLRSALVLIRELRNVVERAALLSGGRTIGAEHLPELRGELRGTSMRDQLTEIERRRILAMLDECRGNQSEAARRLGMPRRTLVKRLAECRRQS